MTTIQLLALGFALSQIGNGAMILLLLRRMDAIEEQAARRK